MSTFKVKSTIKRDGEIYNVGDTIELSKEEAKELAHALVINVSETPELAAPAPKTKAEKEAAEQAKKAAEASERAKKEAEEAAAAAGGTTKEPEDDGLEALTVPALMELAEKEKIETVSKGMLKVDVIEAIRVARKAAAGDDEEEETL